MKTRFGILALMGLVLLAALAFMSWRFATVLWGSVVLPMTLALLATMALGVVVGRKDRRAFRIGFTLFGGGYLALVSGTWWSGGMNPTPLATTTLVNVLLASRQMEPDPVGPGPLTPFWGHLPDPLTVAIESRLDTPVSIPFAPETTLDTALKYLRSATISPSLPNGLPIYIDPVGLQEADKTMSSTVKLQMEGIPLRWSLKLMLSQIGLGYEVRDGLITITDLASTAEDQSGGFHQVAQCWWTLLAGLFGGIMGRYLDATGNRSLPESGRVSPGV